MVVRVWVSGAVTVKGGGEAASVRVVVLMWGRKDVMVRVVVVAQGRKGVCVAVRVMVVVAGWAMRRAVQAEEITGGGQGGVARGEGRAPAAAAVAARRLTGWRVPLELG